jgi:hypothetical protein
MRDAVLDIFQHDCAKEGCGGWFGKWCNLFMVMCTEYKALLWMIFIFGIAGFSDQVMFQFFLTTDCNFILFDKISNLPR